MSFQFCYQTNASNGDLLNNEFSRSFLPLAFFIAMRHFKTYKTTTAHASQRKKLRRKQAKNRKNRLFSLLLTTALLSIGLSPGRALADTPAGTEIRNTATGAFEDPEDLGTVLEVTSNEVVVTVAEVAGIGLLNGPTSVEEAPNTVAGAGPNQGDGEINPEDVVYFTFRIINLGNDATQFFIPEAPASITGGTQAGDIQIIAYDPDGTGASAVDLSSENIVVPSNGATTGALLTGISGTNDGSVLVGGTVTLRVPIKTDGNLNEGETVTVVMGDTPAPPNASDQNQPYAEGTRDIYTQDNADGAPGEAVGMPINGDATNRRQEASTRQSAVVGIATGDLSGRVWKDFNGDGLRAETEEGLDGIAVELFDSEGNSQGTVNTAGGGFYQFFNLPVGEYVVEFTPPETYTVALLDQGNDDTIDSDVRIVVNQTNPVLVSNGVVTQNVDLGLVPDSDGDSATDPEEGTGDIDGDGTPNFLDFDPTGYFYDEDTGEIIAGGLVNISGDGAEELTIKYDGSTGYYQWLGEVPGIYTQTIILPPNYAFSELCLLRDPSDILDPTGGPRPTIIGAFQEGNTGFMQNTTCVPSYLSFDLEQGDPLVINNNIPLKRITTAADYGDAPDMGLGNGTGNYQTIAIDEGPSHLLGSGILLGATVTADDDGLSFVEAPGYVGNATEDSGDDGVQTNGALLQGETLIKGENVTLNITTQGSGFLNAWIDWNADGVFESSEQIATNVSPSNNAIALQVRVPEGATVGSTYARFRFSTEADLTAIGAADDGEVEDYQVAIAQTQGTTSGIVWEDANFDGIQTPDETGVNGVTVNLIDTDEVIQQSVVTTGGGLYTFSEIVPEDYTIEVEVPENFVFSPQNQGSDPAVDSDVNRVTGLTETLTLAAGETIEDIGAALSPDADGDTIPDVIDGTGDRDGDGVLNVFDVDPAGYFYDEATGQVIPGGLITVSGPGAIDLRNDGNATGYYQWFIDGTAGTYRMTVTPPPGYELSTSCLISTSPPSPFDPTGLTPDPYPLGELKDDGTGALVSADCADNPFYLDFDLATGDPFIINNNIPLKVSSTPLSGPGICPANQQGGISSTGVIPYISDEVGPNGVANRDAAISLDDDWRISAQSNGLSTFQTWLSAGPDTTIGSPYQLLSAASGASVDVFVSSLDMVDINDCTGTVTSSAIRILDNTTLQDNAPRPNGTTSDPTPDLYDTAGQPRFWNQSGGSSASRNGVLFEFASPVAAFGAWFGDLETRTDNGTPAILRLLDVNDVQIGEDQIIEPDPSFFTTQSDCGGANSRDITGCGNSTTRWIGFVDPLARVSKMVVIVGDDDAGGNGSTERLSFIGATLASGTNSPNLFLIKRVTAINSTAITGVVDGPGPEDNDTLWPTDYLQGAIDTATAEPGDELEYTIYFLSSGNVGLTNVNMCDLIPTNTTYIGGSGEIALGTDPATPWDDARDTDVGEYIAPATAVTAIDVPGIGLCRTDRDTAEDLTVAENPNGAVWGELDKLLSPIPAGQAGYLRFRVRVDDMSPP